MSTLEFFDYLASSDATHDLGSPSPTCGRPRARRLDLADVVGPTRERRPMQLTPFA